MLRHIVTLLLSKNATQLKFSGFLAILYLLLLVEADFLCQLLLFYICVICVTFFNSIFYYFFFVIISIAYFFVVWYNCNIVLKGVLLCEMV